MDWYSGDSQMEKQLVNAFWVHVKVVDVSQGKSDGEEIPNQSRVWDFVCLYVCADMSMQCLHMRACV